MKRNTEEELLHAFLAELRLINPDVTVGHNFINIDLNVLLRRMKKYDMFSWNRIGRRKLNWPVIQAGAGESGYRGKDDDEGVVDTLVSIQDLFICNYDFAELVSSHLNIVREGKTEAYKSNGNLYNEVTRHCSFDAYSSFALMMDFEILPLRKQPINLSGNLW